jgi:hypothetical protein
MRGKLRLGAIVGALLLALPALSSAQTLIVVNSSADPTSVGNCTLRDAILIANNNKPPIGESCPTMGDEPVYEITFANSLSGGEIDLASPLPTITVPVNLAIDGPQNPLYINSLGRYQILSIANSTATVFLENLVITGGASTGNGGGINNIGALTIRNCTFFSDEAQNDGGAIYNTGTLSAMNSTFYNDVALLGSGGAFYNDGELILTNDTFYADTAQDGQGGAIYNANTAALVSNTFDQNGASAGGGGAIFGDVKTAIVTSVRNTVLVGSIGGGNCGGLAIETAFGGDFADDSSCNLPANDVVASAGIVLDGTLAQNGGPTLTIALEADGPARGSIPIASCTYPESLGLNPCTGEAATPPEQLTCDQRGAPRPGSGGPDGNCDSGAYEFQGPVTLGGGAPTKPSRQLSLNPALDIFARRGATQTLRVANRNSVAVPVSVTVSPLTDFQITSDTCGSEIAANASCSVAIRFEANQIGLDAGQLTVSDGASSRAPDALLIGAAL